MIDVGDKESVSKRKKAFENRRKQELNDLREVLATRAGKAVIWRILSFCEPMAVNMRLDASVHQTEARRQVATWLISELTATDSRAYIALQDYADREARQQPRDEEL